MCKVKIIDMRNNNKVTVEGTFSKFSELLEVAGINLDFARAKGVVSETRNSLESADSVLPNLVEYKIYIYAKESKGGTKTPEQLIKESIEAIEEYLYKIDDLSNDIRNELELIEENLEVIKEEGWSNFESANSDEIEEGKLLAQKLGR